MRCPSCGTENQPDSRFCGGCGAKLGKSSVAPTQKMPDDAGPVLRAHSSPPTSQRPASIPPTSQRPASSIPPRAVAMASSPSLSMVAAPPRRRWGLVIIVLLADLGLAAAGAVMLGKGLAKAKSPEPKPVEVQKSAAVAPPPTTPPPAPAPPVAAPVDDPPPPAPPPVAAPVEPEPAAARKDDKAGKHHDKTLVGKKPGAVPIDPYAGPDLATEVDNQGARAQVPFARCYNDANAIGPIHGSIRIAFQILPDGTVAHASAVENTTGSDALASCLGAAIGAWRFTAHAGPAAEFVRPFSYP